MKLQKHFVNKRGDKVYYKHVVVLSPEDIKKSGFKSGDELVTESKKGEIKLKKK